MRNIIIHYRVASHEYDIAILDTTLKTLRSMVTLSK
jgi:hypothetical protein